jgi:hypothetical protein
VIRFAICSAVLLLPFSAQAQDAETRAGAAQLWAEAWALKDAGESKAACEKFFVVQDLYPSASAHVQAGECYEQLARFASAWSAFDAASSMSQREPDELKRARLRESSRAGIERTEAKRSWLTLVLEGKERPASLELLRNGKPVPVGILGQALPSDAGAIEFELRAKGYAPNKQRVTLSVAQRAELRFVLEPLPAAPPSEQAASRQEPEVPTWAWVVGATGLALSGVSIGFVVDEQIAVSNLNAYVAANCSNEPLPDGRLPCDAERPEEELARRDRGIGLAIGFGAAGAAALIASAVGIGLGLTEEGPAKAALLPWVTPQTAGLLVGGRFQ